MEASHHRHCCCCSRRRRREGRLDCTASTLLTMKTAAMARRWRTHFLHGEHTQLRRGWQRRISWRILMFSDKWYNSTLAREIMMIMVMSDECCVLCSKKLHPTSSFIFYLLAFFDFGHCQLHVHLQNLVDAKLLRHHVFDFLSSHTSFFFFVSTDV